MEREYILHGTSTPGRSETNGRAERNVRHLLEGTRSVLAHSGVPTRLWPFAARYFSLMENCRERTEYDSEGRKLSCSAWFKKNGTNFDGKLIPFGALVDYMPVPESKQAKGIEKMSLPCKKGVFLGYFLEP